MKRMSAPAMMIVSLLSSTLSASETSSLTPDDVIRRLADGNTRYVNGTMLHAPISAERRAETAEKGQHPFATILSCSDSREVPEFIFDTGIGDLFVIRVAGNVADTDETGSAEYGTEHLGTPVLVVLGHTSCGAVTAVARGDTVHGSIPPLVDNIVPAVVAAKKTKGEAFSKELVDTAIRNNIFVTAADLLKRSEIIRHLVAEKKLRIVGALYHIDSGAVEWLGEHPDTATLTTYHEPFMPPSALLAIAGMILLQILAHAFFVARWRLLSRARIRTRILAGYAALAGLAGIAIGGAVLTARASHSAVPLLIYTAASVIIAVLFAFLFTGSIIHSFRTVIDRLKAEIGGAE